MPVLARHDGDSGSWWFADVDIKGFQWYPVTPQSSNWITHLLALRHEGGIVLAGLNYDKDHLDFGKYNGRGGIVWTPTGSDIPRAVTHVMNFEHKRKSVIFAHDRASGVTCMGCYEGNGNVTWFPEMQWEPNHTSYIMSCAVEEEVLFAQHSTDTGDWYFGKYNGRGGVQWFPRHSGLEEDWMPTHAIMFEHDGKAVILKHHRDSGHTRFGHYNNNGGIHWYEPFDWAPNWTTQLLACKEGEDVLILQLNSTRRMCWVGKYTGDGGITWLFHEPWPVGTATHVILFRTDP
eukprot:TRINITY_DN71634_c0_g1_i1.p1 TRINITY_DN71634_c0_g1~~TRINITY_DN71634_c0_g1_i1.p1  ORF type:complete len:290 (+),score=6.59 TRINITY_DN71634_c0_g1_i1:57-926(+)